MVHVGLDIHRRRIAVCVLSETGQEHFLRHGWPGREVDATTARCRGRNEVDSGPRPALLSMPLNALASPRVALGASVSATIGRRLVNRGTAWGRRAIRAAESG
jgi:hypothetical protein